MGFSLDLVCLFQILLSPEHPPVCDEIELSCSVLNVTCFIKSCQHKLAIVSCYQSPSTDFAIGLSDLCEVLNLLFNILL